MTQGSINAEGCYVIPRVPYENDLLGDPNTDAGGLSAAQVDLRVLDALVQAGLSEQTLRDLVELHVDVLRDSLRRLVASDYVTSADAVDPKPHEPSTVWVATPAGRSHLAAAFAQNHVAERIREILLVAVDNLNPTTPELTRRLRWHLPAIGLRRLRDVHEGWVRRQLSDLATAGLVKAIPEQTAGDIVWVTLPPVENELTRLDAVIRPST